MFFRFKQSGKCSYRHQLRVLTLRYPRLPQKTKSSLHCGHSEDFIQTLSRRRSHASHIRAERQPVGQQSELLSTTVIAPWYSRRCGMIGSPRREFRAWPLFPECLQVQGQCPEKVGQRVSLCPGGPETMLHQQVCSSSPPSARSSETRPLFFNLTLSLTTERSIAPFRSLEG